MIKNLKLLLFRKYGNEKFISSVVDGFFGLGLCLVREEILFIGWVWRYVLWPF